MHHLFLKLFETNIFSHIKRHPRKYLHECLSTIINMVLSVEVYYYKEKNIANFKRSFFRHSKKYLWSIFYYLLKNIGFIKFIVLYFIFRKRN
nr:MAG TPA: hypothetical protein [Bacteriophage sp.]